MPYRHKEGEEVELHSFLTSALDGGQRHTAAALPPVRSSSTSCTGDCVVQGTGLEEFCEQILPPLEFEARTILTVASHYNDYALKSILTYSMEQSPS